VQTSRAAPVRVRDAHRPRQHARPHL